MQKPATNDEALARRFPEQIAIAIARDAQGKHNPITISWTMLCSHEPLMMAIAVGKQRHSYEAIRNSGEFVLSFPSINMDRDLMFHGKESGREMDKLARCGTATQPATAVNGVLLADSVANFECRLESEHETGDHVIFVGRVIAAHMHEDADVRRIYSLGNEQRGGLPTP